MDGHRKIFTLFTTLQELKGYEEHTCSRRPTGVAHGEHIGWMNWKERREESIEYKDREPSILVVGMCFDSFLTVKDLRKTEYLIPAITGAGQSGITVAARLDALGVDTLVIDNENVIGDDWRKRYRHVVLHDPV